MASEFFVVVTAGGVRVQRRHVDGTRIVRTAKMGGGARAGVEGLGRVGRPVTAFTPKARRQMRWVWNALPWEEVDDLLMVTLTYPAAWRECCPDGATAKRHLRAFRERWRRRWGGARGTWVIEFQPRVSRPEAEQLAPHFHLYVGLPKGAVIEEDDSDGRPMWEWARQAWWEVVGSGNKAHRFWGVHVRRAAYGSGRDNGKRVGDYLWRESGKFAQKQAPEGFEGVKWWDVWGMEPVEHEREITYEEFVAVRRPLKRLRNEVVGAKVRAPFGLDGLSVTNVNGLSVGPRLLRWAQELDGVPLG